MKGNIAHTRYSINMITFAQMHMSTLAGTKCGCITLGPSEGSGIMLLLVVERDKQETLSAAVSYSVLSASAWRLSAKNPMYTCCNKNKKKTALRFKS